MRSPGGSPHAPPKVGCIPANRTGTCCATRWFRYGRRGPSVVLLPVASAKVDHFFSTGNSDHAGRARQNLSRSDAVRIFYDFSHRKPLKHCPHVTQRAFVVRFRSSLACGPRAGPHTRCQKLGAFRQTALALAVQPGGFGMGGGDPRSYFSRSHPPKSIIFPLKGLHLNIQETPENNNPIRQVCKEHFVNFFFWS